MDEKKDSKSPGETVADCGITEESYEGPEPGEPHMSLVKL